MVKRFQQCPCAATSVSTINTFCLNMYIPKSGRIANQVSITSEEECEEECPFSI